VESLNYVMVAMEAVQMVLLAVIWRPKSLLLIFQVVSIWALSSLWLNPNGLVHIKVFVSTLPGYYNQHGMSPLCLP
jgi:hypothetical protein